MKFSQLMIILIIFLSSFCVSANAEPKYTKGSICEIIESGFKPFYIRVVYAERMCKLDMCYAGNYKVRIKKGERKNQEIGVTIPYGIVTLSVGYEYVLFLNDIKEDRRFIVHPTTDTDSERYSYEAPKWSNYYAMERTIFLNKDNKYYRDIMPYCYNRGIDTQECAVFQDILHKNKNIIMSAFMEYPNFKDELKQCLKKYTKNEGVK